MTLFNSEICKKLLLVNGLIGNVCSFEDWYFDVEVVGFGFINNTIIKVFWVHSNLAVITSCCYVNLEEILQVSFDSQLTWLCDRKKSDFFLYKTVVIILLSALD